MEDFFLLGEMQPQDGFQRIQRMADFLRGGSIGRLAGSASIHIGRQPFDGATQAMDFAMRAAHGSQRIAPADQSGQTRVEPRIILRLMRKQAGFQQLAHRVQVFTQLRHRQDIAALGQP